MHCGEPLSMSKLSSAGLVDDGPGLGMLVSSCGDRSVLLFSGCSRAPRVAAPGHCTTPTVAPERTVLLIIKGWRLAPRFSDANDITIKTATKERRSASVGQELNRIRSRAVPPFLRSTIHPFLFSHHLSLHCSFQAIQFSLWLRVER